MMKKEILYEPKHLKRLSIMIAKRVIAKKEEDKGILKKIKKLW